MPSNIFISYRRSDASAEAHAIYGFMSQRFDTDGVFIDVDSIVAGSNFEHAVHQYVDQCAVLLAVIGPTWISAEDEDGQRRLDNSSDFVRLEISSALTRGIPVVPVLVGGAPIPDSRSLPEELKTLSLRQVFTIRPECAQADLAELAAQLQVHVGRVVMNRATLAVASGVALLSSLLVMVLGVIGGFAIGALTGRLFPAVSGKTDNVTDGLFEALGTRNDWRLDLIVIAAAVLGFGALVLFIFARVMERSYRNIGRTVAIVLLYGLSIGSSIANFVSLDSLLNIWAQWAFDVVIVFFSLSIIPMFASLPAKSGLLRGAKVFLTGIISITGIALPGLFFVMFALYKLHVVRSTRLDPAVILMWIAGSIALVLYRAPRAGRRPGD